MSAQAIMPSPRTPPAENQVIDCGEQYRIELVTSVFTRANEVSPERSKINPHLSAEHNSPTNQKYLSKKGGATAGDSVFFYERTPYFDQYAQSTRIG
jgi:hypothetical protein